MPNFKDLEFGRACYFPAYRLAASGPEIDDGLFAFEEVDTMAVDELLPELVEPEDEPLLPIAVPVPTMRKVGSSLKAAQPGAGTTGSKLGKPVPFGASRTSSRTSNPTSAAPPSRRLVTSSVNSAISKRSLPPLTSANRSKPTEMEFNLAPLTFRL